MTSAFSILDWFIVSGYLLILFVIGWSFSKKSRNIEDYFLGSHNMAPFVVAISVIATTQSAATFLGGPDQGYRGNFTYLAANISALIGALFVARVLIPKYYEQNATTVYDILNDRYGELAMRAAGLMYIVGRFFASGARLFLAAIAISMILFSNIDAPNIILSSLILVALGFSVTFLGGIRSVIWTDLLQFVMYVFSAIAVLYFLLGEIPLSRFDIIDTLAQENKLTLFDASLDFSAPYALISIFSGMILLYIASLGLDQDITQRLLTCKKSSEGGNALILSTIAGIPIIALFMAIGSLLYIFYDHPELVNGIDVASQSFNGERVTIFMFYILNELPAGLKGLVTVGVIAAAVSTINSGLNSMSSVLIQDFYRPLFDKENKKTEKHFVRAGQIGMALVGIVLFAMSIICYYWQRYSELPLIDFALSLMVFAYSGLLGVYFTVLFTNRGSNNSVIAALITGFMVTLFQQKYFVSLFDFPEFMQHIAFSWQLLIGTTVSFLVCCAGNSKSISR
ncbi:sodium:solute symporter [Pseudemcibacter aquimaris]|uniref:sodium:solute symporter n=1 Tax=Pseudemcibacter aquimaris TaxID=2857064 RepID=UPI002011A92B|nr:sodium:solute symporter [Pseudemcibacter aquimaris]MCC3862337.1 sodium:solute symporter [Pseudemcibacter aquimaris]WDU59232.1 sodium:solute symporter [Pseudemcibacter aquimaris]